MILLDVKEKASVDRYAEPSWGVGLMWSVKQSDVWDRWYAVSIGRNLGSMKCSSRHNDTVRFSNDERTQPYPSTLWQHVLLVDIKRESTN